MKKLMHNWKKWLSVGLTAVLVAVTLFMALPDGVTVKATTKYISLSVAERNYSTYVAINPVVAASADDSSSRGGYSNTAGEGGFGKWDSAVVSSAFRFTGVNLPADAIIDAAYVKLTAQYSRSDNMITAIYVEHAAAPAAYGASEDYTARSYLAKVNWDFSTNWVQDTVYNSASLVAQIQGLVDFYGEYDNGTIALYITDDGSGSGYYYQATYPYDTSSAKAAVLYIYYHTDGLSVLSAQVATSADDSCSIPSYSITNGEQRMGDVGGTETKCGYRFTGITLPSGATISRAKLVFNAQYGRAQTPALIISGEDTNNPSAYGATEDFTSRTYTTATVNYTAENWGQYNIYASSDIKTIIDELIASYTYSNDEMAFMIVGNANFPDLYQVAYPYDTSSAKAVKLLIYYTSPSLTNVPDSKAFGVVAAGTSYYAYGSAPSNPVADGECTFTITNDSAGAEDIDIKGSNFTGGVGWTLAGSTGENQVKITAYYSGQNPASGVVLTTSDQEFYDGLAGSATIKWDFKMETPTSFTDGVEKTGTITLTAVAED